MAIQNFHGVKILFGDFDKKNESSVMYQMTIVWTNRPYPNICPSVVLMRFKPDVMGNVDLVVWELKYQFHFHLAFTRAIEQWISPVWEIINLIKFVLTWIFMLERFRFLSTKVFFFLSPPSNVHENYKMFLKFRNTELSERPVQTDSGIFARRRLAPRSLASESKFKLLAPRSKAAEHFLFHRA